MASVTIRNTKNDKHSVVIVEAGASTVLPDLSTEDLQLLNSRIAAYLHTQHYKNPVKTYTSS